MTLLLSTKVQLMLSCYLFLLVLFASLFVDLLSCWLVCLFDCSLSVSLSGCLVINLCCGNQGCSLSDCEPLMFLHLKRFHPLPPRAGKCFFLMIKYFEWGPWYLFKCFPTCKQWYGLIYEYFVLKVQSFWLNLSPLIFFPPTEGIFP